MNCNDVSNIHFKLGSGAPIWDQNDVEHNKYHNRMRERLLAGSLSLGPDDKRICHYSFFLLLSIR